MCRRDGGGSTSLTHCREITRLLLLTDSRCKERLSSCASALSRTRCPGCLLYPPHCSRSIVSGWALRLRQALVSGQEQLAQDAAGKLKAVHFLHSCGSGQCD